jgi:hypothetical protein
MALTVSDFMFRRCFLDLLPSLCNDAAETVSKQIGILLGWDNVERQSQLQSYLEQAASGFLYREAGGSQPTSA